MEPIFPIGSAADRGVDPIAPAILTPVERELERRRRERERERRKRRDPAPQQGSDAPQQGGRLDVRG